MDTVFIKYLILSIIILIIIKVFVVIYKKVRKNRIIKENRKLLQSVTQLNRGTDSEKDLILGLLKYGISSQTIFHDLYVKKYDGKFSQIDLVVPTKAGIIVVEVKDYSGWIFGNGNHLKWTQVLAYGNQKYRFFNPVKQNNQHINVLKKQLKENVPFYSLIVFYGDCIFKDISFVPNRTFILKPNRVFDVLKIIINESKPANYKNKRSVINILRESVKNGESKIIQNEHVKNIKNMLGEDRVYN
ncbi:MAG: NERD domain-containing protein [Flavobacteriaceae bacterium]|nr:NERD domain-containing protein [Flavobacteriaceae bacterium]